ncbi:MAG TPA: hypothetical protein VKQ72_04395, partial [Aggregatilineales bacterium]|nr:hypothetical protein [Aggregatilineales bacterium]
TAILWDVQAGTARGIYYGHTDSVTGVAFSPDGKAIVIGSKDKTAMVWPLIPAGTLPIATQAATPAPTQ